MVAITAALLLQVSSEAKGLVLAMLLSYLLGFSGMFLAYLNYRKRHGKTPGQGPIQDEGKK
jgi:hypothetical protein